MNGSGDFFSRWYNRSLGTRRCRWAVAGVIAHDYPGPAPELFVYGLAATVASRACAPASIFPRTVRRESLSATLVAQTFYSRHHIQNSAREWRSIVQIGAANGMSSRPVRHNFRPIGSWIYPALEALATLVSLKQFL